MISDRQISRWIPRLLSNAFDDQYKRSWCYVHNVEGTIHTVHCCAQTASGKVPSTLNTEVRRPVPKNSNHIASTNTTSESDLQNSKKLKRIRYIMNHLRIHAESSIDIHLIYRIWRRLLMGLREDGRADCFSSAPHQKVGLCKLCLVCLDIETHVGQSAPIQPEIEVFQVTDITKYHKHDFWATCGSCEHLLSKMIDLFSSPLTTRL